MFSAKSILKCYKMDKIKFISFICVIYLLSSVLCTNKIFGNGGDILRNVDAKEAYQSSYFDNDRSSYGPNKAIYSESGGLSATQKEKHAWWSLEFNEPIKIHRLTITSTSKSSTFPRVGNIDVWVMNDTYNPHSSRDKVLCKHYFCWRYDCPHIYCGMPLTGRFVSIAKTDSRPSILALRKAEVLGGDYWLPCHCANKADCDPQTGECPRGECATLLPDGGWSGPACQTGNVALDKPTDIPNSFRGDGQIVNYNDSAVDGKLDGACTEIPSSRSWIVDLLDVYALYNVTLVSSTFAENVKNQYINLGHSRYHYGSSPIDNSGSSVNVTVPIREHSKTGRYLGIGSPYNFSICEIIALGYKWIHVDWDRCADPEPNGIWCKACWEGTPPTCLGAVCETGKHMDGTRCRNTCGHCANSAPCHTHTGNCHACGRGWKTLPLCKEKCDGGTFGTNCSGSCGHCNGTCDPVDGKCPLGCQLWYLGDKCDVIIPVVNINDVAYVKQSSDKTLIILELSLPYNPLDAHHKLIVEYKTHVQSIFEECNYFAFHYNTSARILTIDVRRLKANTKYWLRVFVARMHMNQTEKGKPTTTVEMKTTPENTNGLPADTKNTHTTNHFNTTNHVTNVNHYHLSNTALIICAVLLFVALLLFIGYIVMCKSRDCTRRSTIHNPVYVTPSTEQSSDVTDQFMSVRFHKINND